MDESRRQLVSKDIPLNRVGRLKSLFQLGKPIPVEDLQLDGGRSNQDNGATLLNMVPAQADRQSNVTATIEDGTSNLPADETGENEQPRINTAVVAKRFHSAKAIFDQIEQQSRQSVVTQSPSRKLTPKAKDESSANRHSATEPPASGDSGTSDCSSLHSVGNLAQAESAGGCERTDVDSNKHADSPSAVNRQRPPPLVTRPKPVLSAEQIRALQLRTGNAEPKRQDGVNSDTESVSPAVMANSEADRFSSITASEAVTPCLNCSAEEGNEPPVDRALMNGESDQQNVVSELAQPCSDSDDPSAKKVDAAQAEINAAENNAVAQDNATEMNDDQSAMRSDPDTVGDTTVGGIAKRTEVIMSESGESDAIESVTGTGRAFSRDDVPSVDEDDDEGEDVEEEEEDNLRDFEDNERRLTIEYRLEQLEKERENAPSANYGAQFIEATSTTRADSDVSQMHTSIDVHYLPDGNFFFDVPGLPCASRDNTIDDEADESSVTAAPEDQEAKPTGKRRVHFGKIGMRVFSTYAPFEYDRRNEDIDPIGASAEYELEKRIEKMEIIEVELEKDLDGLGISIVGMGIGAEAGIEKLGIFVKAVAPGGAAARDGRIRVCDQLIEVDSTSLVGVTQAFAAQVLRNTRGVVHFVVGRERDVANSDIARLISLSLDQDRIKQQRLAQLLQAAHAQSNALGAVPPSAADFLLTTRQPGAYDAPGFVAGSGSAPIATLDNDDAERDHDHTEARDEEDREDADAAAGSDSDLAGDYDARSTAGAPKTNTGPLNVSTSDDSQLATRAGGETSGGGAESQRAEATASAIALLASAANRNSWPTELNDVHSMLARFDELHARNVALEAELVLLRNRLTERDSRQSQAEQKLGELIQIKVSLELQLQLVKDQLEGERRQFADRETQLHADLDLVTRKYKKVKRLYKEQLTLIAQHANSSSSTNTTSPVLHTAANTTQAK